MNVIDTACFTRVELEEIAKRFIELDKANDRIEYLKKVNMYSAEQIDITSRKVDILNKDLSLCKKNTKNLTNLNNDLKSSNDKLKATRNISIGLAGLFGLIAIIK